MNDDQSELDFDSSSSDSGYRKWQEEMGARKNAIEHRWGIILGRRVRLTLKGYDEPVEGAIRLDENKTQRTPQLIINKLKFNPTEIESVTRI